MSHKKKNISDNGGITAKKAADKKKTPAESAGVRLAKEFGAPVETDVLGSYTGNAENRFEEPQQDADDL